MSWVRRPARDGAVLALSQYKIANPAILARIPQSQLQELLRGNGYDPVIVAGDDPATVHQQLCAAFGY